MVPAPLQKCSPSEENGLALPIPCRPLNLHRSLLNNTCLSPRTACRGSVAKSLSLKHLGLQSFPAQDLVI